MFGLRLQRHWFARSRLRRQMQFAPERKNLALAPEVRSQVATLREEYQEDLARPQLFSDVLFQQQQPKLGKVFKVDERRLAKGVREQAKKGISMENVSRQEDDKYPEEQLMGKSHLYDQAAEIQMERQFKKQLFRKKETKRLIDRKFNDPENWLPKTKDQEFKQYLEAKNLLKNVRIEGMLNHTRVNRDLELLIQSGLMDNPENLKKLIESLNGEPPKNHQTTLPASTSQQKADIAMANLPMEMGDEVVDAKDFNKFKEFLVVYDRSTQQNRQRTLGMLDLLRQLRQYEEKTFESRYDAINFRFGGRVDFDHFTEAELLSYLKHEPMQPQQLLLIFDQNLGRLSRTQNSPVITPTVAAQIYTRSCLFKFPETELNNRINMLADKKFIRVERYVFENCDKLSNEFFADALEAFSRNHVEEQGAIKPRMFEAILGKVSAEFEERVGYLPEAELGSVCRSLVKLPIFGRLNEAAILEKVSERLEEIESVYVMESLCLFVSMLQNPRKTEVLRAAIEPLAKRRNNWDHRTLTTMARAFSPLLLIEQPDQQAVVALRRLFNDDPNRVVELMDGCVLNDVHLIAGFLIRLSDPSLLIFNKIKKMMIDTLRKQLSTVLPTSVPQLTSSLAYFDYWKKYKTNPNDIGSHSFAQSFFLLTPVRFNSKKFLPYHEVAKFLLDEFTKLTPPLLALTVRSMSLVGYKNESFYDAIAERLLLAAGSDPKSMNALPSLLYSFYLQKRSNNLAQEMFQLLRRQLQSVRCKVEEWMQLMVAAANLPLNNESGTTEFVVQLLIEKIWPYRKQLTNEHLAGCLAALAAVKPQASPSLNQMIRELTKLITEERPLRTEVKLLLRLSAECLALSTNCETPLPTSVKSLQQLQNYYSEAISPQLRQRHDSIGSNIPYAKVCEQFYEEARKEEGLTEKILKLPWRIEISNKQIVHFLVTYDMVAVDRQLQPDDSDAKLSVHLTGVWKLYQTLYQLKGYQIKLLETYLWKNG